MDENNDERLASSTDTNQATTEYDDEYGEQLLSYSLMDSQDVYSYLSGDYN